MRGVVTLAAAFLLPEDTPQRPVLQLAAFVVVAGTLVLQGLTLGPLVRRVGLRGPDSAEDALQTARATSELTGNAQLLIYEIATRRTVEISPDAGQVGYRGGVLWWSTGNQDTFVRHSLDLRTVP